MRSKLRRHRAAVLDAGWGLISEAATIVTTVGIFLVLGRTLGPETYGAYIGIFAVAAPFQAFTGAGAIPLTIYELVVRGGEDARKIIRSSLGLALSTSLVLGPLAWWLAKSSVDANIDSRTVAFFIGAELIVGPMGLTLIAGIQATRGYALAARLRVSIAVSRITVVVGLALIGHLTLPWFAPIMLVMRVVTFSGLYIYVSRTVGGLLTPRRPGRNLLGSWIMYAIGLSSTALYSQYAIVTLNRTDQTTDAGLYGAALRVVNLSSVPMRALLGSTHLRFLDPKQDRIKLSITMTGFAIAIMSAFAVSLFVAAPLVELVLGSEFKESIEILRWLAPVLVIRAAAVWPLNAIMGHGYNNFRVISQVIVAVVSILMYQYLVPRYGWQGAVIGVGFTEAMLLLIGWVALLTFARHPKSDKDNPQTPADECVADLAPTGER